MGWWSRCGALALLVALAGASACNGPSNDDDGASVEMDGGVMDGGGAGAAAVDCDVVAPTQCPNPAPTFADIQPILQERCVGCHAGIPDGPWPLTTYTHVASWAGEIRAAMLNCLMPPADAGIEMPTAERELILLWIRCGFKP